MSSNIPATKTDDNPLLRPWTAPFEVPPFPELQPEHYRPAFDAALAEHRAEIDAIAGNPAEPSFGNTIDALELAGQTLRKVSAVFFNICGTDGNDATEAIEREIAPVLARHRTAIMLNETLFRPLGGARRLIEAWRHVYNYPPHSKLGWLTPVDYAACWLATGFSPGWTKRQGSHQREVIWEVVRGH